MNAFDAVVGQPAAVQTLTRALRSNRAHHAYRFEGPDGVGKELCAFAFAQALVCEHGTGCGRCSACQRAATLCEEPPSVPRHPDVVLLEKGLYPPAVLGRSSAETAGIGVEQVRRIVLERAAYPPHEARRLVFIFRAAHQLTVAAANALLKTLEEPRDGVHFALITDQPRRLLDTIVSRTLPVRFGPLPESALREILERKRLEPAPDALALAGGSAARAIELSDPDRSERRRRFVKGVLRALRAPDLGEAVEWVAGESPDREGLGRDLLALGQYFAATARHKIDQPALSLAAARRHAEVVAAAGRLERNAPPALVLESLIAKLRRVGA